MVSCYMCMSFYQSEIWTGEERQRWLLHLRPCEILSSILPSRSLSQTIVQETFLVISFKLSRKASILSVKALSWSLSYLEETADDDLETVDGFQGRAGYCQGFMGGEHAFGSCLKINRVLAQDKLMRQS